MTKFYFLSFLLMFTAQVAATETDADDDIITDSVYIWGDWENGLKPAAGFSAKATPPPAKTPNINFRPNENSELVREAASTVFPRAPSVNGAPQLPNVGIAPINTPTSPISGLQN